MPPIKSKVKELMSERGYSIRMLAAQAQLSVQTVQRARSAQISECRLCTLHAIASALNLPVSSLFEEIRPAKLQLLPAESRTAVKK